MQKFLPPFASSNLLRMAKETDITVQKVERLGTELTDLIPAYVTDAYQFLDLMFIIRNGFFNAPKCTTLGRFTYLLQEICRAYNITHPAALDPESSLTYQEIKDHLMTMDYDLYRLTTGYLVMGIGLSSSDVLALPIRPVVDSFPSQDTHIQAMTLYGVYQLTYRLSFPEAVESEEQRVMFLRHIASRSKHLSPRSLFMITDPMFPLELIPGVHSRSILESVASTVESLRPQ